MGLFYKFLCIFHTQANGQINHSLMEGLQGKNLILAQKTQGLGKTDLLGLNVLRWPFTQNLSSEPFQRSVTPQ